MNEIDDSLESGIEKSATTITDGKGKTISVIVESRAANLAGRHGCSLGRVYLTAMAKSIWPMRYIRNRESIAIDEQMQLAQSRVAVIGAGGLGGYILLLLARTGIGHLTIIDSDCFEESNLNRQILADTSAIGRKKAAVAADKIAMINPAVAVEPHAVRITKDNAADLIDGCHIIIDALDNMETRRVVHNTCRNRKIPLVHGAISGFEGRLMSIFPDDPPVNALFEGGETPAAETILGTSAIAPAVIGSLQAMEAIKIILNRGRIFRNRMLYADLETGSFDEFTF